MREREHVKGEMKKRGLLGWKLVGERQRDRETEPNHLKVK